MKLTRITFAAATAAAVALTAMAASPTFAQMKNERTVTVGGAPMYPSRNIVQNAVKSKDHTTLVAAVKAAGLVDTLSGSGPFTVFAPTNAAFKKLPAGTVQTLLKPENQAMLTKILTCHVVSANAMSSAIRKMIRDDEGAHPIKTVGGCTFTAVWKNGKIMIRDGKGNYATVTIADVRQSNGVIHVIDTVLLPS
ncbi:MAG: fasciclin domain-containing protein [Xanthobacteraceae bacterium]